MEVWVVDEMLGVSRYVIEKLLWRVSQLLLPFKVWGRAVILTELTYITVMVSFNVSMMQSIINWEGSLNKELD